MIVYVHDLVEFMKSDDVISHFKPKIASHFRVDDLYISKNILRIKLKWNDEAETEVKQKVLTNKLLQQTGMINEIAIWSPVYTSVSC